MTEQLEGRGQDVPRRQIQCPACGVRLYRSRTLTDADPPYPAFTCTECGHTAETAEWLGAARPDTTAESVGEAAGKRQALVADVIPTADCSSLAAATSLDDPPVRGSHALLIEETQRLRERVRELEEALKPFAEYAVALDAEPGTRALEAPTLWDVRQARRALEPGAKL